MKGHNNQGEFYVGLVRLYILHEASKAPVSGLRLITALVGYGYGIGAGTLYAILHSSERRGLLRSETAHSGGRARRMYRTTAAGKRMLRQIRTRCRSLVTELFG